MIDANLSGGDEIIRRLGALYFDNQKMQKFSRLAGAEMVHQTEERFYNQHDLQRQPWLPSKRALEQGGKTLRDTSRLLSSLTYIALPDGVKWGTNVVYARMMHYGGTKAMFPHLWGDIPARPYMGMNDDDRASVLNIINRIMDVDL
ncbi:MULTISPECIES: phage virion morphogenesis protein [unclassified Psychrobacter]|uniref:phage virion morphogenesis protein n=1 Tax=unclassified Psychrobacter TaxID=196806 RepID=UPI0025F7F8D4|nr:MULTISPECIES: phage virion morphogenesis protein [unclassified Psychrobacter]